MPSVYVVNGSRGTIASALALDVVIDDRLENCPDVAADSKARSILIWRNLRDTAPQAAASFGIETTFSMVEVLERLQQTMTDRRRRRA